MLLTQAFRKKFVIPDFPSFASHIDELYESAKDLNEGQVCAVPLQVVLYFHPAFLFVYFMRVSSIHSMSISSHSFIVVVFYSAICACVALFRLLTTFPSLPNSVRTCGLCPYAQWMDKGRLGRSLSVHSRHPVSSWLLCAA